MADSARTTPLDRTAGRIALAAIVIGAAVRLWVVAQRGSLWLDEASLALNVLARDFGGLARPLDWGQAAPVGWLWAEKFATVALGPAEWVLRLLPFAAGAGTLWLLWEAGRRLVEPTAAALATVALAFSLLAIRYSAEAKPYATDAFVTLALVGLASRVRDAPGSARRWITLGAAGIVAILISMPSLFVLSAVGVVLTGPTWHERGRIRVIASACGVAWLATFGVLWTVVVREESAGAYLREYWAPVMLDPRAPDFVARVVRAASSAVATPLQWTGSVSLALAAVAAWIVGLVMVARRDWRRAVQLGGPFASAALASMLGLYPVSDRLAYFTAPLALLAAAEPLSAMVSATGRSFVARATGAAWAPAWIVAALLAAWVASDGERIIRAPGSLEPTRDLFRAVRASADSTGTGTYVFARAVPAWVYATTDWTSADHSRLDAYIEASGPTDSPAHENYARSGGVELGEGEGLVAVAKFDTRVGRNALTDAEFIGLAPGVRYRIAGPTSADAPSPGWADEEARRISMIVDGSFAPAVWVVASHFFEGTPRDELRPLLAAIAARGLQAVEERRGGYDAVAIRFVPRGDAVRR